MRASGFLKHITDSAYTPCKQTGKGFVEEEALKPPCLSGGRQITNETRRKAGILCVTSITK